MKSCARCKNGFEIYPADREFYAEYDFPEPELCPNCRHQQRCAYRNERNLYKGKCDLCKKSIITIFSGQEPFPVYCPECWWSDKWDALSYGREFDFSRPFFEQFHELQNVLPRLSLNNVKHDNSDYCNQCTGNRNCYLLFASDDNEDCLYSYWINRCADGANCSYLSDCGWCFDVLDAENCFECVGSQDLKNCRNCLFCFDLIGCRDCFGSAGLRNKQYYFYNKPYSRDEYQEKLQEFDLGRFQVYEGLCHHFPQVRLQSPHKYIHVINSEDVLGDYISHSKNCFACYDVFDAENCRYSYNLVHQHFRNFDVSYVTETKNVHQVMGTIGQNLFFTTIVWYSNDVWYSDLCSFTNDLFGCIGLTHKKHCILNRQYSPGEYFSLREKIILHMKRTGEWGRFFPWQDAPYAYNESVAQDLFPLEKDQAVRYGWKWLEVNKKEFQPATFTLPDNVRDTPPAVTKEILSCLQCHKNYKILPKELETHQKMELALPRLCPDCRLKARQNLRNPRQLFSRQCQKCGVAVHSTYAPERPETIYCEKCYQEAMV